MNEYEQWLYDSIVINKPDKRDQALRGEQKRLQKELEDQITGAQRRMLRRWEEIAIQLSGMDTELIYSETLTLARTLLFGQTSSLTAQIQVAEHHQQK